ncbi:Helix-turn-helix [Mycobacteroides abscessus subsp. abscessus]|nr:Helix-turn-helix [Mycobacteroides abscessus subsp. abscessus]
MIAFSEWLYAIDAIDLLGLRPGSAYVVTVTSWVNYLQQVAGDTPQNQLAEMAGVAPSQVSRWKSGATVPSAKAVKRLAAALGRSEAEALAAAGHAPGSIHAASTPRSDPFNIRPTDLRGGLRGHYYTAAKTRYLDRILKRAREGSLPIAWRDELVPITEESWGSSTLVEVDALAVADIQSLPVAAWEPFQAEWRPALESWYVAARTIVSENYINTIRDFLDQIIDGDRLVAIFAREGRLVEEITEGIAPLDVRRDSNRTNYEMMYVVDRTRLTASYLAGLAAGGLDIDWRSWYSSQIESWPDDRSYKLSARLTLTNPDFGRLPEYWTAADQ